MNVSVCQHLQLANDCSKVPALEHVLKIPVAEAILADVRREQLADGIKVGMVEQCGVFDVALGLILPLAPLEWRTNPRRWSVS